MDGKGARCLAGAPKLPHCSGEILPPGLTSMQPAAALWGEVPAGETVVGPLSLQAVGGFPHFFTILSVPKILPKVKP